MKENLFSKGFKKIIQSFFFMFLGPTLMFQSLKNEDHPWFTIVFSISIIVCIIAIVQGVRGLKNIVDSIFKKKDS
jgi:predicted permease